MYDDILLPTDGSEEALTAVEHGFGLAELSGARIHALYVVDNTRGGTGLLGADTESVSSQLRTVGEEALAEITARGEAAELTVQSAVREGLPHEEILDYADEHDIDLLVMSSRGRSGVSRFVFGSVTERVVRLSERPVLVVSRGTNNEMENQRTD